MSDQAELDQLANAELLRLQRQVMEMMKYKTEIKTFKHFLTLSQASFFATRAA